MLATMPVGIKLSSLTIIGFLYLFLLYACADEFLKEN